MERRRFLELAAFSLVVLPAFAATGTRIDVYKTPSCGCCDLWVEHLKQNGFAVTVNEVGNTASMRLRAGFPARLASCHTAFVDGYAVEGHVPAADIGRLLKERPKAIGLAVPGMPMGSPGMEGPRADPYDVLLVRANGGTVVYRSYPGS
jgi:hypothetical protein